jgi:hypothetical protein
MIVYVLHDSKDELIVTGAAYWRNKRRQPKAYTSERNARIAVGNKSGAERIVPYVAITDDSPLVRYLNEMEGFDAAHLLRVIGIGGEANAKEEGRTES